MAKKNPASISKTALDSLHAKLSAIDAGWLHSDSGDTSSSSHPIHVYTNLLQQLHQGSKRRQSPLVNAGYAARMAVMGYTLERWIDRVVNEWSKHITVGKESDEKLDIKCINVIMIGCGMDVLGIWSKHLLQHSLNKVFDESNKKVKFGVKVYEFDCWDNCVLKKESLLESGLLAVDSSFGTASCQAESTCANTENCHYIYVQGCINLDICRSDALDDAHDYTLVSLDLREVHQGRSILSQTAAQAGLDVSQPTIVLSELVLAYLGYEGANAVMKSASDMLNGNKLSMFACLEPMFPTDGEPNGPLNGIVSVQEAYARDYSKQFLGKLQNGSSGRSFNGGSSWLYPLGSNLQTLQSRLVSCGHTNTSCATLRDCTTNIAHILRGRPSPKKSSIDAIGPKFLCAKEPFDEHAALALNMGCYCVVCSFHPSMRHDSKLIEEVCPWFRQYTNNSTRITIKPIATSTEDAQVNGLYGSLYLHLYNEYPAIRKMVKSALKGDLSVTRNGSSSPIRDRFKSGDGDFWVAIKEDSIPKVVGCIGIKRRSNGGTPSNTDNSSTEYEIYRFAVDDSCRGQGIGKRLLEVAEAEAASKGATNLYAVTPSCLDAANQLYETFDYSINEAKCFMAGSLRMNVYSKVMSSGE